MNWYPCANNKGISYRGPFLEWTSTVCSGCGEVRYTYLRAFTHFCKRGAFWKMPSTLAERRDGVWYGPSLPGGELNRLLRATGTKPTILCCCSGKRGVLTKRLLLACANRDAERTRSVREFLRRQSLTTEEHYLKVNQIDGGKSGKPKRKKIVIARPKFTAMGGSGYGIERDGIGSL